MYEAFYSLTDKPFQLSPDPTFYFDSRQHHRAMSYLEYGLHQNEGFIVITGEIGAGKTTLVRNLLSKLDPDKVVAAHLVSTQLNADDTLRMVASSFGIPSKSVEKSDLLLALEAYFVSIAQQGKRCLLIVDEAQNLSRNAVEELRMLSNFQLEAHALVQSFLVGQPEFRQTLQSPDMEQLRQRVIAASHISPMSASETQGYIEHRLKHVGWNGSPSFEAGAHEAIYESSAGIPRRINSLCDRLLWHGYLAGVHVFKQADVIQVAAEMLAESSAAQEFDPVASREVATANPARPKLRSVQSPADRRKSGNADAARGVDNQAATERLQRLDEGIKRLEHTLLRIERNNLASMALFRRALGIAGTKDGTKGEES